MSAQQLPADLPRRRAAADVHGLPRAASRTGAEHPRGEPDRARLGARARSRASSVGYAARHRRRAVPPRRRARDARHRRRRRRDGCCARGDAPHGRLDPARDRARLRRLRLPRRADPRLARASRTRATGWTGIVGQSLHGAGGPVRHPARRRRDLHRAVHDLRRGARVLRRGALLRRAVLRRVRRAAAPARAARPRWPASCSARCRAPASRRRSRSARSPGRCCARAGYPKNEGGGVLAAAGIGAILSPPTLGAAAFIIAEFLEISYLKVLVYATRPDAPLLPRDPARDRGRHAALRGPRAATSRRPASGGCSAAGATTSRR